MNRVAVGCVNGCTPPDRWGEVQFARGFFPSSSATSVEPLSLRLFFPSTRPSTDELKWSAWVAQIPVPAPIGGLGASLLAGYVSGGEGGKAAALPLESPMANGVARDGQGRAVEVLSGWVCTGFTSQDGGAGGRTISSSDFGVVWMFGCLDVVDVSHSSGGGLKHGRLSTHRSIHHPMSLASLPPSRASADSVLNMVDGMMAGETTHAAQGPRRSPLPSVPHSGHTHIHTHIHTHTHTHIRPEHVWLACSTTRPDRASRQS